MVPRFCNILHSFIVTVKTYLSPLSNLVVLTKITIMSVVACSVGATLAEAWLATNFCVEQIPVQVGRPRSVVARGTSDMFVLERDTSGVVLLKDTNGDGLADSRTRVATASGLNHGLAVSDGFIYASSDTTVYRWPVNDANAVTGTTQVVISNIEGGGNHVTRTLAFDSLGRLYVSVGSRNNIDTDSSRARIRRFTLKGSGFPIDFATGEVFADGLRNEVGLAFDKYGVLWGVENSADNLKRNDLGGDIHNDNPAEELNQFREVDKGKHWGYPWCWSEFSLPEPFGEGPGTPWAWPNTIEDVTDAECRANYVPTALALQAHSAPLGITFYQWKATRPAGCVGAFPKSMDGYAFVAYHGSWNRDEPTGYKVVYVEMDANGNVREGATAQDLLKHKPPSAQWPDGFRPVDVDFDDCGRLLVTSDGSGGSKVVRISSKEVASLCFSGQMTVELEDKSTVRLQDVKVGDKVKVDENKFEPIYGFGHADSNVVAEYLDLQLSNGRHLEVSADHLLFVGDKTIKPASILRVGNELLVPTEGSVKIDSIRKVRRTGVYAPFTYSGTIVVNGVKSSTYVSLQQDEEFLAIGNIKTPFSHHWLAQSFLLPFRVLGSDEVLSAWINWLEVNSRWLLAQHPSIISAVMIPSVAIFGAAAIGETLWLQPGLSFAIGLVVVVALQIHGHGRKRRHICSKR